MVVANPQVTGRFKYWHAFLSFEGCEVLQNPYSLAWGDDSVGKALALQTQGSEFDP